MIVSILLSCSKEYQLWRTKDQNKMSSAFFCVNFEPLLEVSQNSEKPNNKQVTFKTLQGGISDHNSVIAFADPCTLESYPGWPLRNLLLLLAKYCPERLRKGIMVLCFRQKIIKGEGDLPNKITAANSLILRVCLVSDASTDLKQPDLSVDPIGQLFTGRQSTRVH